MPIAFEVSVFVWTHSTSLDMYVKHGNSSLLKRTDDLIAFSQKRKVFSREKKGDFFWGRFLTPIGYMSAHIEFKPIGDFNWNCWLNLLVHIDASNWLTQTIQTAIHKITPCTKKKNCRIKIGFDVNAHVIIKWSAFAVKMVMAWQTSISVTQNTCFFCHRTINLKCDLNPWSLRKNLHTLQT